MPDNAGERRECLVILEKVDWKAGLLQSLSTDPEVSKSILESKQSQAATAPTSAVKIY